MLRQRLARLEPRKRSLSAPPPIARTPFFCSGCPHNTSTKVPEGSRAMAGIGCHGMAVDGAPHLASPRWAAKAPLDRAGAVHSDKHVFQNLGDGTYFHSGLLAIRAAVAAGVNITYKILYNDAVAMTGGQPHRRPLTVPQITRRSRPRASRRSRGHRRAGKYPRALLRRRRARSVTATSSTPCSASCASARPHRARLRPDLRRREAPPPQARHLPDPDRARVHQRAVCEGCGDCGGAVQLRLGEAARDRVGPQAQIDQSAATRTSPA
jgi:indolepyruvate ferredoxin oxidoreductase